MEEIAILIERHEQKIKRLEEDIINMREIQNEIKSMNAALITLTTELKHTKEHLVKHDAKIEELDSQPKYKLQQIFTAIVSAFAGAILSFLISFISTK